MNGLILLDFTPLVCLLERIVEEELKLAAQVDSNATQTRTMIHPAFPDKTQHSHF